MSHDKALYKSADTLLYFYFSLLHDDLLWHNVPLVAGIFFNFRLRVNVQDVYWVLLGWMFPRFCPGLQPLLFTLLYSGFQTVAQ